jgi:hypothetical protein
MYLAEVRHEARVANVLHLRLPQTSFDSLKPQERQAILRTRLAYLQGGLDYLHKMQQLAQTACPTEYAQRVLSFHLQRVRNEYQWVATWLEEMQATQS